MEHTLVIGAIFGDSDKPPRNTLPKNVRARLKVRGSAHQISIGGINLQEQKSQLVTIEVSLLTSKSRYFVRCASTRSFVFMMQSPRQRFCSKLSSMSDLFAPIVQWRVEFLLRKKWIYPYGMHYKIRSKTMSEEALADICTTGLPVLGWKGLIICAQWLFEPYFSIFFHLKAAF